MDPIAAPSPKPPSPGTLRLGCALWSFKGWIGSFYPPDTKPAQMLELYAARLTAVEGNSMFYTMPSTETLQRWAAQLPEGFAFCPKLSRELSHRGLLSPALLAVDHVLDDLQPLARRAGPIFAQLPPSYGPDRLDDLERFLTGWSHGRWPLQLEVRHPGWFDKPHHEALTALLRLLRVGRVSLDTRPIYECDDDPQVHSARRKPRVPLVAEPTTSVVLVRYIGHPVPDHNQPYLLEWAERIDGWLRRGLDVLFFAHCPMEERSPELARRLHTLLSQRGAPVEPLPWDSVLDERPQLDLFS
ncbi:MAG TPA: DUF72 domain-containing protein [Deltaproteobacteria bacterium]|nr:DUF72 domain-containing protein [Deltaproteobacteria bacterium]